MNDDPDFHPLADLFPLMDQADLERLADDIRGELA